MNVNPLIIKQFQLTIDYPDIDYLDWKYFNTGLKNLKESLEDILKRLDLRRVYYSNKINRGIVTDIKCYFYTNNLKQYYWYLLHIDNVFEYNIYLDKLIKLHERNLYYDELINTKVVTKKEKKINNTTKRKVRNRWYKETKVDMFTGEEHYTYYNPVTKEEFVSDDPNKLDKLNTKPKKEKKINTKGSTVPLEHMTFSFKKQ